MARSKGQKEGVEELREQMLVSDTKQNQLDNELYQLSDPELLKLLENHKLGENVNGWKNPHHLDDPRSLYLQYQYDNVYEAARFKAWLLARQTGKDFSLQGEAVEDCYRRTTQWLIGAPSERQALGSLEQGKLWAKAWDMRIEDVIETRFGSTSQTLLKSSEIVFSNGSRIFVVPGRPDTVRGFSANVGLTEVEFFEKPRETWRAILPSITNPLRGGEKMVRLISTPNGKSGLMWKISQNPEGKRMKWAFRRINLYQAVLMGLPVDVEALREAMDDPEGFNQECLCIFLDGSNVLLPYEIIALCESFEATEFIGDDFWDATGTNVNLGIDFGRTNDPTVCWATEEIGGMSITREVCLLRGMNTVDQANELDRRIRRARRVCLDYTGPGIGFGDILVKKFGEWNPAQHKFGKIELCTFSASFNRILYPRLRQQFTEHSGLKIPVSVDVREDLHEMNQIVQNGQYSYKAKRTAEGHSDRCTALALNRRAAGSVGVPLSVSIPGADLSAGSEPDEFQRAFQDLF